MLLEELNLLESLEAISVFHPVKATSVTRLGGGVFLTKKAFKPSQKKKIIFFDQSMEMRRNLSKLIKSTDSEVVEVFTRKLGAFEAYKVSVEILSSFLKGCDVELARTNIKVKAIKAKLLQAKIKRKIIFFLGEFKKNTRDPDLLIVNDGFVKDLIQFGRLKTYPSTLEYVSWSQKILKTLNGSLLLSITDSNSVNQDDLLKVINISDGKVALRFRGALAPGIRQVFLIDLLLPRLNHLGIPLKVLVQ
jgi:hypothetical protein